MTSDPNGPGDPDGRQGAEASGKRVPPWKIDTRLLATILIDDRLTTTQNIDVILITSRRDGACH